PVLGKGTEQATNAGGFPMNRITRRGALIGGTALALGTSALPRISVGQGGGNPIKIGYSMSQTGGLGPNGQSALLAQKIWEEQINKKGGLLGRPVQLISYDDQTNPSTVPGIYSKLVDVDKVDLIIGGYGTNLLAPAMPFVIQRKKYFVGLLGLAVNHEFNYPNYFSLNPSGPDPKVALTEDFFDLAMKQEPKPRTVAIVAADAEFARNGQDGARTNAKKHNLRIVYDRNYPPATADFAPIVRAVQAANPDIFVICSYPPDSVGMARAINEIGFAPKMIGGGMVGLQNTAIKTALGPILNGYVNYDFWLPAPKLMFPGVQEMIQVYQQRAPAAGVDPLGYYMAPQAYAQMQVIEQAVTTTKTLEDQKLADYTRQATFKTVVGDIKFGKGGEWEQSRVLQVQFQNVKGNGVDQFRGTETQVVVTPEAYASGKVIYPFASAKK
ncbi:MAG TPA: amino acid ABC transporter substrate-binding protein, partial [Xanthobacteraceae bacterium]|nr:amino acid ABC transporter substrate-binding protein [Xanthobacteraceae bacterium]